MLAAAIDRATEGDTGEMPTLGRSPKLKLHSKFSSQVLNRYGKSSSVTFPSWFRVLSRRDGEPQQSSVTDLNPTRPSEGVFHSDSFCSGSMSSSLELLNTDPGRD